MKQLLNLVFTYALYFSSPVTSQDQDQIICQYGGVQQQSEYKFDVADVPDRCDIILYGYYILDFNTAIDSHVREEDKSAISSLASIEKPIYIFIYKYDSSPWEIFNQTDEKTFTEYMDPLVNFINQYKISGLVLGLNLYSETKGLDSQINSFADYLKKKVTNIRVGIIINGDNYLDFTNTTKFNYEITNEHIDIYCIDMTLSNNCDKNTKLTGQLPIKSDDKKITSMTQMSDAAIKSSMTKDKLYAGLFTGAFKPKTKNGYDAVTDYKKYCTNRSESRNWCRDDSATLYDKGKFSKDFSYHGVVISYLETDDFSDSCKCGKYPGLNIIIDGFEKKPFKKCANIDA